MSSCIGDKVTIARGRNVWLLLRTDRDGVDGDDAVQTGAAFLHRILNRASPFGQRSVLSVFESPRGPKHVGKYYIGAARPVDITAQQLPEGNVDPHEVQMGFREGPVPPLLGHVRDCKPRMAKVHGHPWLITASFDWRAPAVRINWPARKVGNLMFAKGDPRAEKPTIFFGSKGVDWLLVEARHLSAQPVAEDSSLVGDVIEEGRDLLAGAADKVRDVGKEFKGTLILTSVLSLGGVLAYYLISQRSDDRA